MSYAEYYLARKISGDTGLGRKVWLLKLPREAGNVSSGENLLGSLVQEVDRFLGVDYPLPFHLTTPQLFFDKLEELAKELKLEKVVKDDRLAEEQKVAGVSVALTRGNGLEVDATGNFPGLPVKASLNVDFESTHRLTLSFGAGSVIRWIPTDYLMRLSRHFKGDDRKVDPSLAVSISDNLIVDMVVIAKNYTLDFQQKSKLDAGFDAEANLANAELGGKFKFSRTSDSSFRAQVLDGVDYVVGLKTIDWDDLD